MSNTGVNLDDDEWGMLTFNFENIKEAFTGRKDALKDIFTRPKQDPNIVKVYKAEWYLNGKMIVTPECGRNFFPGEKLNKMHTVENWFQGLITLRKMCIQNYV